MLTAARRQSRLRVCGGLGVMRDYFRLYILHTRLHSAYKTLLSPSILAGVRRPSSALPKTRQLAGYGVAQPCLSSAVYPSGALPVGVARNQSQLCARAQGCMQFLILDDFSSFKIYRGGNSA